MTNTIHPCTFMRTIFPIERHYMRLMHSTLIDHGFVSVPNTLIHALLFVEPGTDEMLLSELSTATVCITNHSNLLQMLLKYNYIVLHEKNDEDRRRKKVTFTPLGKKLVTLLHETTQRYWEQLAFKPERRFLEQLKELSVLFKGPYRFITKGEKK